MCVSSGRCVHRRATHHIELQLTAPPCSVLTTVTLLGTSFITSGQSSLTKRPHRYRRVCTVQSYSPRGANVHPHLLLASLDPPESISQTTSRSVQPFLHSYTLQCAVPSPSKFPIRVGDLNPSLTQWFIGPTRVLNLNGISIGSAIFAGLTIVTDHATASVTIRILSPRSLRCGLI